MKKYILLLFLGFTSILNAQNIELNVSHVAQYRTEWCSTAAAKCVLDYYGKKLPNGNPITQCVIMDEYIRKICNSHGGPNGFGCCVNMEPGFSHPCNKGVNLGVFNEKASVKGILMHFGDIPCIGFAHAQNTWYIEQSLIKNNLMVAQWNYYYPSYGEPDAHTVVICGVKKSTVYYMDPAPAPPYGSGGINALSFANFQDNFNNDDYKERKHWWAQTLTLTECSSGRGTLPCHCYNGEWDQHLNEQGVDCGGSCEPCAPPGCFNCQKDPDEQEMDCGGENCPPCEDVPKERIVNNTDQLRKEVAAFNKITAKGNVVVQNGKKVSFITKNEGAIVLQPGFKAEKGCTFTTQRREDLSEFGRICGTICGLWNIPSSIKYNEALNIYDLQYANKIDYKIYDLNGYHLKYSNEKDVSHNGTFFLWNPIFNVVNVTYRILYDTYHCDGSKRSGWQDFTVLGYNGKNSSYDDPETSDPFLSPPDNNIPHQDEDTAPNFVIIPNPNLGAFQIETNFPLTDIDNLKITNMLGATVYETQNLFSNTIQLPAFASGQHFVIVMLKDGTVLTQKMMLQR